MKLLNRREALLLDQLAVNEFQIPIETLISTVAQNLFSQIKERISFKSGKVEIDDKIFEGFIFLIGPGNNGKDGIHLKKIIQEKFPSVKLLEFGVSEINALENAVGKKSWIIIDSLFGVGLDRTLSKDIISAINLINQNKKFLYVISVDIPTGLNADTGTSFGAIIKADLTLTCELAKVGFFFNQGPLCSGEIKIVSAGFPKDLVSRVATVFRLIQNKEALKISPKKKFHGNKTKYGHLLILAGSENMPGALRLSSEAAARSGVGYITIALDKEMFSNAKFFKEIFPDFILIDKSELFKISVSDFKKRYSSVLFGPGLEKTQQNFLVLEKLLSFQIKMLIDAQGLNMIAEKSLGLHQQCVVTPHSGELSRLIGLSVQEIDQDKIRACQIFMEKYHALILAKGAKSVLHTGKKSYIINSGNKTLAKAGTGDVLAGIISAYMAQGLSVEKAVSLGAYIHGGLADLWIKKGNSVSSLLASDLVDLLKSYKITDK